MSTRAFPNPAEVCKERGWGPWTNVKTSSGSNQEITYIGDDYIHTASANGSPFTWYANNDITGWTKVEPRPVVTIEEGDSGASCVVRLDGETVVTAYGNYPAARRIFGVEGTLRIARAMAETGKAFIEGDRPQGAEQTEGPWTTVRDYGDSHAVLFNRRPCVYIAPSINPSAVTIKPDDLAAFIAAGLAELNALHAAKSEGGAE